MNGGDSNPIRPEDFERETLQRALSGDVLAGRAALELCVTALLHEDMSRALRDYLAGRLQDVCDGVPAARALCLEVSRGVGHPVIDFPDWQMPLAAVAAYLAKRRVAAEKINVAMDEARECLEKKGLDRGEALRIRKRYRPMIDLDDDLLLHFMGPKLRDQFEEKARK